MAVQVRSRVDEIRAQLPAVHAKAYLNAGTNGPLPRVAHEAMAAMALAELEEGRIGMDAWKEKAALKPATRDLLARAFNVKSSEIALTQLTTEGMNIMIHGVDWQRGDEAIITNLEHPGGQLPLYVAAHRHGVQIKLVDLGVGDGDVPGKIERVITNRTRALVISHLAWNTGALLPLKEIVETCRRHDVLVLVDAAQSAGSIDPKLYESDPDAYAMPGQKWMCGPEGTGSMWIREERVGWFQQTYVNYGNAMGGIDYLGGYFTPTEGAARFDRIATYYPLIAGQRAATEWLVDDVDLTWAYERIADLGKLAHKTLSNVDGVEVITPKGQMAGLVSFN
ncbi:MAG: aminotransferase class V-fold PLP-dependent enzyme, partial [Vicinamibacterales bacterium]